MDRSPHRTRSARRYAAALALSLSVTLFASVPAGADVSSGEPGSGPSAPVPAVGAESPRFSDVDGSLAWAAPAIRYVAVDHHWMDDHGTSNFKPKDLETRELFARAIVRAFAPSEATDAGITFTDVETSNEFYPYANVAVKLGWMQRTQDNAFEPKEPVTMTQVHFALINALPLNEEVNRLANLHTADGYTFDHPDKFPQILLGMRLHLRYNHSSEGLDVTPHDPLSRAEVAYSLWQAASATKYDLETLVKYRNITLPAVKSYKRKFITFGLSYVGYPYIWGGDWYEKTPSGYCCGAQPTGGFDCSGLMWWDLKAPAGGYNNKKIRGYEGWNLPQRTSADMAATGKHLSYGKAKPGDLMFYDGDNNGTVDHVDVYLGNGWALDSSSGQGGVTILRVGEGWYHDHFVHARHIMSPP
jgi:hypothetical protein